MYFLSMGPYTDDYLDTFRAGTQSLEYRVRSLLGIFLTDAISRYRSPSGIMQVVVHHPGNGSSTFAHDLGLFQGPPEIVPTGYTSWEKYAKANPDLWREMIIIVERNGYGWLFDGIVVKFATTAIVLQACLGIGHIALVLSGRWTSSAGTALHRCWFWPCGHSSQIYLRILPPGMSPKLYGVSMYELWAQS
jgi:hypothetical protein